MDDVEKTILRFEQNIVDGLNNTKKLMDFEKYPWTEAIKKDPKPLLTYLSSDHKEIGKQVNDMKGPLSKKQFESIENLFFEISSTPHRTFQAFKLLCDELEGWTDYKLSLESFTGCIETLLNWLYETKRDVSERLQEQVVQHKLDFKMAEEDTGLAKIALEKAAKAVKAAEEKGAKAVKAAEKKGSQGGRGR